MSELSDKLKTLADKAVAGELTDEDRIELREIAEGESKKDLPEKLSDLAKQAEKQAGLSAASRRELAEISADVSKNLIERWRFDQLSATARNDLVRQDIKVIDAPQPIIKRELKDGEISRSQFDALSASEKSEKMKTGLCVIDIDLPV